MAREIKITPSILNADLTNLGHEISRIASVSDLIHLDVMDNIFVPNFTFDFERASQIIKECPIAVDAHLMVADVDAIAPAYAEAGCSSVTIHAEATRDITSTLRAIRKAGARAGLGLKPATSIEAYADCLDDLDMIAAAGLGIAFNAKPVVKAAADSSVSAPYLDSVLYLLGIPREAIEED